MQHVFHISIPSDDQGFIGRACNSPDCRQYFKINTLNLRDPLYCPYCGLTFSKNSLLTREQTSYLRRAAAEEARVLATREVQKMLKNVFSGSKNITYKLGPRPVKRTISPTYKERDVDTELKCPDCDTRFQIYGIFGYCPGCRCENLQIYDANWANIKRQIAAADDKSRQLRHAYSDLVATFETFCAHKATKFTSEMENFQHLSNTRKFFQKHAKVDILDSLSSSALLSLRRLFQKRHICIHAGGVITDRYVKMIPEDAKLLGTKVALSESEFEDAALAMRYALGQIVKRAEYPGK